MENKQAVLEDGEIESVTVTVSEIDAWTNFGDDDIMQQQYSIQADEAKKFPFVGDKARLSAQLFETCFLAYLVIRGLIGLLYIVLITSLPLKP